MLILDGWTFMIVKLLSRQKMCQKVGNSEIYNANMLIKVCQCMCQSVTRHEEEGKLLYVKCENTHVNLIVLFCTGTLFMASRGALSRVRNTAM